MLTILISLTFIVGLAKAWHLATDGFRTYKITPSEENVRPYYTDRNEGMDFSIFDQPFLYLNRGSQAFCFESQDGKHVLKLLRHHKYRAPLWADIFSFYPSGSNRKHKELSYRKNIYQRVLKSYKIAATDLKEESGTLYLHLAKTKDIQKTVTFFDKVNSPHQMDLDACFFILQKKADAILSKALLEKKKKQDLAGAERIIHSFLSTIIQMMEKELTIRDHNCMINFGVQDEQVQMIDQGAFIPFNVGDNFVHLDHKTRKITKYLNQWIAQYYPELLPYATKEMENELISAKELPSSNMR